ncbi:hypothetical protein EHV15_35065 [Paenibacillus oralis]|uniref:YdbS-like PH domain-containing protein n=1 Tax=Paenibacillus oralis TaxID=2490856 RepID=A0A3P3TA45_9BACL|nr:PH domain-containing protein [Paenibacillus oralis]RRJ54812.1 hypothetical protein EHV15_35065 [Paenibacillus oralis]
MYNQLSPLFEVKPVFRPLQTLVFSLIISIFITMFFGSFLVPILGIIVGAIIIESSPGLKESIASATDSGNTHTLAFIFSSLPIIVGMVLYFTVTLFVYRALKQNKEKTVYSFFEDHMTYFESYRKKIKTTIKYSSISAVDYTCSPFQERLGLGTVSISTGVRSKTINLFDIPNPDEIYQKIEELTETHYA